MTHDILVQLVGRADGALMLISWPFIIYEALGKSAGAPDLKVKLDLRRGQILSSIVFEIEHTLRPYWPQTATRIIVEPEYNEQSTTVLSDAAKDAIRDCLSENEGSSIRAASIRCLAGKVLTWDRVCYWFTFITAVLALVGLSMWFFYESMSDLVAKLAIIVPMSSAVLALVAAALRQVHLHRAHDAIVQEE